MIEIFAIVAGGLLLGASWMLYIITKRSKNGQSFCGREPDNSKTEIKISVDEIKKQ